MIGASGAEPEEVFEAALDEADEDVVDGGVGAGGQQDPLAARDALADDLGDDGGLAGAGRPHQQHPRVAHGQAQLAEDALGRGEEEDEADHQEDAEALEPDVVVVDLIASSLGIRTKLLDLKKGLDEVASGRTGDEMSRARELGTDLLAKVTEEGMRAYYEKASTDTKLDLAPLMEAMNEVMQGLRGREFGPHQ